MFYFDLYFSCEVYTELVKFYQKFYLGLSIFLQSNYCWIRKDLIILELKIQKLKIQNSRNLLGACFRFFLFYFRRCILSVGFWLKTHLERATCSFCGNNFLKNTLQNAPRFPGKYVIIRETANFVSRITGHRYTFPPFK